MPLRKKCVEKSTKMLDYRLDDENLAYNFDSSDYSNFPDFFIENTPCAYEPPP